MTALIARVAPDWLSLREPADARARSIELVDALEIVHPAVVHDLGCGTGSMLRWLAPRLPSPQRWVLHDHDPALVDEAETDANALGVATERRIGALSAIRPGDLHGASLVTASALLDVLTAQEIDTLVASVTAAGCPALFTLSVLGLVDLFPTDPFDKEIQEAFNDHQRRDASGRALLGPDALWHAKRAYEADGYRVLMRPTPWELDETDAALVSEWFDGWVGAACEQRPELRDRAMPYRADRLGQLDDGRLRVTVHHVDLLATPS